MNESERVKGTGWLYAPWSRQFSNEGDGKTKVQDDTSCQLRMEWASARDCLRSRHTTATDRFSSHTTIVCMSISPFSQPLFSNAAKTFEHHTVVTISTYPSIISKKGFLRKLTVLSCCASITHVVIHAPIQDRPFIIIKPTSPPVPRTPPWRVVH